MLTWKDLIKMANFKTRLELFRERVNTVSPTPAVLFALLKELIDILIKNQKEQKDLSPTNPHPPPGQKGN